MLNVDYSKPFLSLELIKKIYELAGHGTYTPDSLIESSARLIGAKFDAVHNTVSLLVLSGLVELSDDNYCNASSDNQIHKRLIEYISSDGSLNILSSAIERDEISSNYKVNHFKLFPKYRGLIPLATALDIFSVDTKSNFHNLTEYGFELLGSKIFESSFNLYDDGITPSQLNSRLILQAERGDIAEEFVLGIERRRLAKHSHIEAVKRVSLTNVSAGFDIQSFESDKSEKLDKFIEVKSYLGAPGFYWSVNEIHVAKEKGELYSLVIVDYSKIDQEDYEPSEIKNPYLIFNMDKHVSKKTTSPFEIEPQNFYISWKNDE
jgi:hypothetical protein